MVLPSLPWVLLRSAIAAAGAAVGVLPAAAEADPENIETLKIMAVDARALPGLPVAKPAAPPAQWRTSFGSERRSEPARPKPKAAIDADIVLLQGVTDVRAMRAWFPAGQWRLIASPHVFAGSGDETEGYAPSPKAPVAATAVAVRLRPGLRITAKDFLPEVAGPAGDAPGGAAATAARIRFANRETWALSVFLPDGCAGSCPERIADRAAENIRRVTGGRFAPGHSSGKGCAAFGLRLDPPPPPPRPAYTAASLTPDLGCTATVSVVK
ncbi:MAG: hypothetical protein MUC37_11015 [Hyphomicrobium sp.]|nr:hypothetical protein [Hyphomicrobium sp.]